MSHQTRSDGIARSPARRRRSLLDRLWGLLALLILLTLIVVIPAALIALRGNPLPDPGLNPGAVFRALTSPDDGSLFLAALTWLAWAGWASFALSVLVEVPAHVRGLPSPRLPALGLQQRAASSLLAGAALLFTLPTLSFPGLATQARPAAAVSTTYNTEGTATPAGTPTLSGATVALGESAQMTRATYTVRPGDSLWQIAQDQLGDGARYPEIARLNYGVHQRDGRTLTSDHWLRPGWTLTLPPNATAPPTGVTGPAVVVVEPGDTLWDIAQDTLGDGSRYAEIAAASTGQQADGHWLTDPNLIRPGWHLTGPSTPAAAATASEPLAREGVDHPPAGAPAVTAPPIVLPSAPARAVAPDRTDAAPAATSSRTSSTHTPDQTGQNVPRQHSDDVAADDAVVRTAAGIGALLAAGLLVLLGAKRTRQQRRRRPGQRIAMPPPDLTSAELALRQVEDPTGLGRVDEAVRTLSLLLGQDGRVLPSLRMVRLTAQQIELYLAEPAVLPTPFTGTGDPTIWALDADATLPSSSQLNAGPAPYPSLVTIGHDLDDAHILLDLEHVGALTMDGDPASCVAIMAALAAELATSNWADDLQITVIGCLPTLPAALGDSRVRYVQTLEELLPALEHRTADVRAALTTNEFRDLHHARTANASQHLHGNAWTPEILLLNGTVAPDARARLAAVLHDLPLVGIAAITTGCGSLGEWTLDLNGATSGQEALAELTPIGLALRPQRLAAADLDQLIALFAIADLPAVTPPAREAAPAVTGPDEPTLTDLGSHLEDVVVPATSGPETVVGMPGNTDDTIRTRPVAIDMDDRPPGTPEVHEISPLRAVPALASGTDKAPDGDAPAEPLPPMVQILGPVEILQPRGAVEPSKRRQLTEIAAYLALHPGSDHHGLSEAIWPGARAVDNTRHTALSKLRKWLGTSGVGIEYVPRVVENGYRLHPDVRTDWQLWQALLPDGPGPAGTDALAAALDLVKGKPFAGTNPRRYAWAERDRQDMISAIVDVAHELARRALLDANATLARSAAAAGLQADPGAELLWRDALKAEWLAGDRQGLVSTADRLSALAEEIGDDLEPETIELLEKLLRRPARQVGAR
jgi:DNA-binding SARP family transcriptional activator/LysM repeat protein